jgi:hypothetical protein|tara:strand:+ start:1033 stop:1506 length:474 start_codon:yes stop_codon:yes gene_type:complete
MEDQPPQSPVEPELTDDEVIMKVAEAMRGNASSPEDKQSVFAFLNAVATAEDTAKTGYLRDDKDLNEVGIPKLPVRTFHSLAIIADQIMGNQYFKSYFEKEAEIVTKTSLSRNAKLLSLAVLQKREIADVTKKGGGENKSWFKPKTNQATVGQQSPY